MTPPVNTLLLILCLAAPPEKPTFDPTSNYTVKEVEGWKVYVHNRLLNEEKELGERALKLLAGQLEHVSRVVPKEAVARLREVRIWMEISAKVTCACYHPSRGWLEGHGFNPEKAKGIEVGGPRNFLNWSRHQPCMMLHELAHAYHHQVLGYDHKEVKAAFERAKASGKYKSVLRWDGKKAKHYALTSDQEYFAELSEAYFGTNDFYPFVRAELKEHDPEMLEVLRKVWGK